MDVDAAASLLLRGGNMPAIAGNGLTLQNFGLDFRINTRSELLQIQPAVHRMDAVAQLLSAETAQVVPPEKIVGRVFREPLRISLR